MTASPLEQFRTDGLVEVDELVSGAPDAKDCLRGHNAVMRAGVVLLVAHFEGFLKSLVEEHIDWLSDGIREARSIPRSLRELHSLPLLREIVESRDDVQRWGLLKKVQKINKLWIEDAKPEKGLLDSSVLSRKITSARPDVIDDIFGVLGVRDQVCEGRIDLAVFGEEKSFDIRLSLADLIDCRNDIAHGDASRIPTALDLVRYRAFVDAFAGRLERRVMELRGAA